MSYQNKLEISLGNLRNNIQTLLKMSEGQPFYPMVKSDAYGIGDIAVTSVLIEENVLEVGVLRIKEALRLNQFKDKGLKLLIFGPIQSKEEAQATAKNDNWIPVCSSVLELELINEASKKPQSIHINFNLGMERLGFSPKNIPALIESLKKYPNLQVEGLCGHIPKGGEVGDESSLTTQHIQIFREISKQFESAFPNIKKHLFSSNSLTASYVNQIPVEFGCRVGGSLYGVKHSVFLKNKKAEERWSELSLDEVATLKSYVIGHHLISKGQGVSYEHIWKASKESNILVVAMGYSDGLPRRLSNKAQVSFRGKLIPIVGHVCMDYFIADATSVLGLEPPDIGEEIVIYGDKINTLSQFSEQINTIPYELFVSMGISAKKEYIKDSGGSN